MSNGDQTDYRALIRAAVLDENSFQRLTLSAPESDKAPWERVVLRPVELKSGRQVQVTFEGYERTTAKNYAGPALRSEVDRLLGQGFSRLDLQGSSGDLHIRITRKGRVLISRGAPSRPAATGDLHHDRAKHYPLEGKGTHGFLRLIGIENERGEVRPSMQAKYRQINAFINLVEPLIPADLSRPFHVVDCGCGSAYLTFAVHHYLTQVRRLSVRLTGVDRNREVVEKAARLRDDLGWDGLDFRVSGIADFTPETAPDLVLSLHACDTATDEALAQGVRWESRGIVAAPCCQHELHHELKAPLFAPVTRHGILRERLADLLTDSFRALALRIAGYRAQVVEFVAPEFTPKNLVIRAERGGPAGDPEAIREWNEMKAFWGVDPAIGRLLADRLGHG
jgi:SAM-dependent methyltransferase